MMNGKIDDIINEIKTVIVGKDDIIKKVLTSILAGGHILLEDVPGVGKTTLATAFSRTLGLDYKRVQFTPDTMPSDITGFSIFDKESHTMKYQQGTVMTNVLLADEINRTSSKTQSALLEVMEENQVTVDGVTHSLPQPFIVIATQNPIGSAGTQPLPESQLDRFMIKLSIGYPDFDSLVNILKDKSNSSNTEDVKPIISKEQLINLKQEVEDVYVDNSIYEYIASISETIRNHRLIRLGLSPRGALALCRMSKAFAFVNGRDYVVPSDVYNILPDVCCHRLVLSREAKLSDISESKIISEIIKSVPTPEFMKKRR